MEIHEHPPGKKQKFYQLLYVQVIFALVVGVLVGHFYPNVGAGLKPVGDAFINIVKMIIAPVIFLTIVTGIAGMDNMKSVGRVTGKAMIYFLSFSTLALVIGLIVANLVQPGHGLNIDPATLDQSMISKFEPKEHHTLWESIVHFLMHLIPETLVSPFVSGDILQVLFVSILFGIALSLTNPHSKPIIELCNSLTAPIFKLVDMLMKLAPIGAFGAIAFTVGKFGIASIGQLGFLILTFYVTSLLFVIIVLGAVAKYNGFSIFDLIRYIKDEIWLVFGTSSSEAALPALMDKMEKVGCEKSVVGLVVPMGYSFNLDGTNIYMTLAALFIAQACNIDLTIGQQITILVVAMVSSKGSAGVTGAGFIVLYATLSSVPAIPVAGMALILGIDRLMSQCRALTNVIGNACATIVVAKWDNALDQEKCMQLLKEKKS